MVSGRFVSTIVSTSEWTLTCGVLVSPATTVSLSNSQNTRMYSSLPSTVLVFASFVYPRLMTDSSGRPVVREVDGHRADEADRVSEGAAGDAALDASVRVRGPQNSSFRRSVRSVDSTVTSSCSTWLTALKTANESTETAVTNRNAATHPGREASPAAK